jgi:hypothetical protein
MIKDSVHCSLQDHLRTEIHDLDHPIPCRCKKHRQGRFVIWLYLVAKPSRVGGLMWMG